MILLTPPALLSCNPPPSLRCRACLQCVVQCVSRLNDTDPLYKLCANDTNKSFSTNSKMCRSVSVDCQSGISDATLPWPLRVLEQGPVSVLLWRHLD